MGEVRRNGGAKWIQLKRIIHSRSSLFTSQLEGAISGATYEEGRGEEEAHDLGRAIQPVAGDEGNDHS